MIIILFIVCLLFIWFISRNRIRLGPIIALLVAAGVLSLIVPKKFKSFYWLIISIVGLIYIIKRMFSVTESENLRGNLSNSINGYTANQNTKKDLNTQAKGVNALPKNEVPAIEDKEKSHQMDLF